ncbi:MAG: hypothetical protein NVS3B1_20510 [Marmoricola sp.]
MTDLAKENARLRKELAALRAGSNMSARKTGRPPLPSAERKTMVITFRVDEDENTALNELATAYGASRGEVVREAIRRMANSYRTGPPTTASWGVLVSRSS